MKAVILLVVLCLSNVALAYHINFDHVLIPSDVEKVVRSTIKKDCPVLEQGIQSLDLIRYSIKRTKIDQGYVEDFYSLEFEANFNNDNREAAPLTFGVVKQIEDRSGSLLTYLDFFSSEACH